MGRTLKQNYVTGSFKKDRELNTPTNYTGINSPGNVPAVVIPTQTQYTKPEEENINPSPASVDTGASGEDTGNGAGTTPATDPNVQTFEEYVAGKVQSAYTDAAKDYQRTVVDANSAYKLATSNYGANAETLGDLGLKDSGYSEYMKSQAYATQYNRIQAAEAEKAKAEREADEWAADTRLSLDQAFEGVLAGIADGTYDKNHVDALIASGKYTTEQVNAMQTAVGEYNAENVDTSDPNYQLSLTNFENGAYSAGSLSSIEQSAASAGITTADRDRVISDVQNAKLSEILAEISAAVSSGAKTLSTAMWDQALANKLIREDQIPSIAKEFSTMIDTTPKAFIDDQNTYRYVNENEARTFLNEMLNSKWLDESAKQKLRESFNSIYGYKLMRSANSYKISGLSNYGANGNNFEIQIEGAEDIDVQVKTVDDKIITVLKDKGKNGIYELNGRLYLKNGGKVCEIVARNTDSSKEDFNRLKTWVMAER